MEKRHAYFVLSCISPPPPPPNKLHHSEKSPLPVSPIFANFLGMKLSWLSAADHIHMHSLSSSLGQYFFITTYDDSESFKQRMERSADGNHKSSEKHDKTKQKEKPRGRGKPEERAKPTPRAREEVKPKEEVKPGGKQGAEEQPGGEEDIKVERYVHSITQGSIFTYLRGGQIILEATGAVNPKSARFELIDRRDHDSKPLIESDWIPDDDTPEGQPFFIRPHLHFSHCIAIAGFKQAEDPYYFCLRKKSRHQEGKCHMLFQLIPSKSADPHSIFFASEI